MKKMLSIFALAVIFTACKSNTKIQPENKNMVLVDTTGLSKSNTLTDVGGKYIINENVVAEKNKTSNTKMKEADKTNNPATTNAPTTNNPGANTNAPAPEPIPQDKGLSDAAKGTAIGAGSGAILGAIINKNDRRSGAVIGTVIGAGAGYLIGRDKDRKSGRVARAKVRRRAKKQV